MCFHKVVGVFWGELLESSGVWFEWVPRIAGFIG